MKKFRIIIYSILIVFPAIGLAINEAQVYSGPKYDLNPKLTPVSADQLANTTTSTATSSSTPQFGIRDVKPHGTNQCKYGDKIGSWEGSPCARLYGSNPIVSSASSSTAVVTKPYAEVSYEFLDAPATSDVYVPDYLRGSLYEDTPPVTQIELDPASSSTQQKMQQRSY